MRPGADKLKHTGAISRIQLILRWGIFVPVFIVLMSGCGPYSETKKLYPRFSEKDLLSIVPGKTTKKEILGLLGLPAAMARKGMNVILSKPQAGTTTLHSPESFFEMFSLEKGPGIEHVVYYYQSVYTSQIGFFMITVGSGGSMLLGKPQPHLDLELWVLIDDEKGIVIDYAYR